MKTEYFVVVAGGTNSEDEIIGVYDDEHIIEAYKDTKSKLFSMVVSFRPIRFNTPYNWSDAE